MALQVHGPQSVDVAELRGVEANDLADEVGVGYKFVYCVARRYCVCWGTLIPVALVKSSIVWPVCRVLIRHRQDRIGSASQLLACCNALNLPSRLRGNWRTRAWAAMVSLRAVAC